jgi:hypothetical protein
MAYPMACNHRRFAGLNVQTASLYSRGITIDNLSSKDATGASFFDDSVSKKHRCMLAFAAPSVMQWAAEMQI